MTIFKYGLCSLTAILAVQALPLSAGELFSTNNQNSTYASQLQVLDGRASDQYRNSVALQPERVGVTSADILPFTGKYNGEWLAVAQEMARRHSIPTDLFLRLIQQESGWNPTAKSHAGAFGLAQLMPDTARALGVDPNDPHQNLEGGARYLRKMYDRFGNWRFALAAYNAGPEAVAKYDGIPPYKETTNYVKIIYGS